MISKTEQTEALLCTAEPEQSEHQQILHNKQHSTFLVVTTGKRNEEYIAISELKPDNVQLIVNEKQDGNIHISQTNHNHRESLNMIDRCG